jgi:hypothetical protein
MAEAMARITSAAALNVFRIRAIRSFGWKSIYTIEPVTSTAVVL